MSNHDQPNTTHTMPENEETVQQPTAITLYGPTFFTAPLRVATHPEFNSASLFKVKNYDLLKGALILFMLGSLIAEHQEYKEISTSLALFTFLIGKAANWLSVEENARQGVNNFLHNPIDLRPAFNMR